MMVQYQDKTSIKGTQRDERARVQISIMRREKNPKMLHARWSRRVVPIHPLLLFPPFLFSLYMYTYNVRMYIWISLSHSLFYSWSLFNHIIHKTTRIFLETLYFYLVILIPTVLFMVKYIGYFYFLFWWFSAGWAWENLIVY